MLSSETNIKSALSYNKIDSNSNSNLKIDPKLQSLQSQILAIKLHRLTKVVTGGTRFKKKGMREGCRGRVVFTK